MMVDGRAIAEEVIGECARKREAFSGAVRLGIVMASGDAATESFVRMKARVAERLRVDVVYEMLEQTAATADALAAVARLSQSCDGVIVQLPLPLQIDVDAVLAAIPPALDVDALSPAPLCPAPVAGAVMEILARGSTEVRGAKAVVVGEGRLVGAPCAAALKELGADVTVLVKGDSLDALHDADIVVSGAGVPGLITPGMIKEGAALIDAGTSEQGGKLAGDADPACAQKCSIFTPVPGGVGPIAVAMIFGNLLALAEKK